MIPDLAVRLARALSEPAVDVRPLSGGCVGQVFQATLVDGRHVAVKLDDRPEPRLRTEGDMLAYLARHSALPVPEVLYCEPDLLVMSFVPGDSHFTPAAEAHAAELLAGLHHLTAPAFGFPEATLIGGLRQPNEWSTNWLDFFAECRLMAMARTAVNAGRLPTRYLARLERLGSRLSTWLREPDRPGLIHGDVWTTNVLARGDRIAAFLDPAIYFGDPEIELAFITLFGTFGEAFFDRYRDFHPLDADFFATRRHLLNLYPLLVHVRLFGGSYVASVDESLRRFGC